MWRRIRHEFTNWLRSNPELFVVLGLVLLFYLPTLQTIVNGSEHQLMVDAGEIQIVLNTWGTLHASGYPLYTMLGALMVGAMTAMGIGPAAAVSIVSLVWGLAALVVIYVLAQQLTGTKWLALGLVFCLALMRVVWIHLVSPEVLSLAFLLEALLFWLALSPRPIPHRVVWLTLVGSFAVAHHRTIIFLAPALIYAVLPELRELVRERKKELYLLPVLAIVGALPYFYLPLRAFQGANWVYGDPGTWNGFWDQALGREALLIFTQPTQEIVSANISQYTAYLARELTWVVVLIGLLGLLIGARGGIFRRPARTFLITILTVSVLIVLFTTDIELPDAFVTLIFAVAVALGFGILFLVELVARQPRVRNAATIGFIALALVFAGWLVVVNFNEVYELTHDRTGLDTIALAEQSPQGATFFVPWGTRYFAIGFAQLVEGRVQHVRRADDKANDAELLGQGPLVTPDYTLYARSVEEWERKLSSRVYPRAVAPHLVQIDTQPIVATEQLQSGHHYEEVPVTVTTERIECAQEKINLHVAWLALDKPPRDFAVFVHLLDRSGQVLAQADQTAPVYGWHPLTHWEKGEIVQDVHPLPRVDGAERIEYGLYEVLDDGTFRNAQVRSLEVGC